MEMVENLKVVNNEGEGQFEIDLGDEKAIVTYDRSPSTITFLHTEVPPAFKGKGIAKQLTSRALNHAREENLKVNALCPFTAAYVRRHPEYKDLLTEKSRRSIFGE